MGTYPIKVLLKNSILTHRRLIGFDNQRVIDGIYHIQTLNNYMQRWKEWLQRFNGIGSGYIEELFKLVLGLWKITLSI